MTFMLRVRGTSGTRTTSAGRKAPRDLTHTLHYLLKMLENMQRLDEAWVGSADNEGESA